jgi:hypothetical protein
LRPIERKQQPLTQSARDSETAESVGGNGHAGARKGLELDNRPCGRHLRDLQERGFGRSPITRQSDFQTSVRVMRRRDKKMSLFGISKSVWFPQLTYSASYEQTVGYRDKPPWRHGGFFRRNASSRNHFRRRLSPALSPSFPRATPAHRRPIAL